MTTTLGTHAGDNYSILAMPLSGEANPITGKTNFESEVLTVWRRLWVELDQMAMPTVTTTDGFDPAKQGNGQGQWNYPNAVPNSEPNDFDVFFQPPKPDISVLTLAMEKACITVKEATPTIITSWGLVSRETSQFVHNTTDAFWTDAVVIGNRSRDVTVNNASFWCIQGVGAYEAESDWDWTHSAEIGPEPIRGLAKAPDGIFLLFQEAIRDFAKTGKMQFNKDPITGEISYPIVDTSKPDEYYTTLSCKRSADELNKLVTFHEVLHFFGFVDKGALSYDPNIDGEIMTKYWFFTETMSASVLTLSPAQIAKIQVWGYPH